MGNLLRPLWMYVQEGKTDRKKEMRRRRKGRQRKRESERARECTQLLGLGNRYMLGTTILESNDFSSQNQN